MIFVVLSVKLHLAIMVRPCEQTKAIHCTEHINMMQAVRLTVQTCFIVQAQAQTGTFLIYVCLILEN